MTPYLYRIASIFYHTYGGDISRFAFIFPNKRAGLFFQKYLCEIADRPLFSPSILTLSELFQQLSDKQLADRISMIFQLYKSYVRISNASEPFDEFLYWGEMLLNDFDDVDKYMVDARMLFTNVTDLREIETDFSFLNENQIAAIRTFWATFHPDHKSTNQTSFLAAWQILFELYTELKQILAGQGKGYEGMIWREVVENLKDAPEISLPYEKVVFVGLNALSEVEERLLKELQRRGVADFYWDYDSDKVKDPDNKASYFAAYNLRQFPSQLNLPIEKITDSQIEVIGIPSGIGQAKQVCSLLEDICQIKDWDDEKAIRTAVILPDETLLIPVLNAIPETIQRINVTMGYPLGGTPVAALMEYILTLQKNIRYTDRYPLFYYRDVLPVLNHRYIVGSNPDLIGEIVRDITQNNRIYIGAPELSKTELLKIIFTPVNRSDMFSDYLLEVLVQLNIFLIPETLAADEEDEDEDEKPLTSHDLEREFIFHYFLTVSRMKEVMEDVGIDMHFDTYFRLLKRITESITIPFQGEPLAGLQIMGVLETRLLDFDRIIMLSMNEGVFPQKKPGNSFIPYNLRRGFGMPTYEHQDSVWAYHFYRLIHRAQQISLIYDTRNNGLQSGEMSRFIHQLNYHYEVPLKHKLVIYHVSSSRTPPLEIHKTGEVVERLAGFCKGANRALSASAINTYLDCPLKFYFSTVEGVQEEEVVNETIRSDIFGSILHKVMEDLYKSFRGKLVTADLLDLIRKDNRLLTATITKAFAEVFFKTDHVRALTGQNYLIGEMIRKYVIKVLERDKKITPFRYLESEKRIKAEFLLSDNTCVQLKGFIDRVDEVQDRIRIIDYKSGSGSTFFNGVEPLFDIEEKDRAKAVMQVFMYAWMYNTLPERKGKLVQPGIYYMRDLFNENFDPSIYYKVGRGEKKLVETFVDYEQDFETGLRKCLEDIFCRDIPFIQSPNGKACVYCNFKEICGK